MSYEPAIVMLKSEPLTITLFPETAIGLHALIHWLNGYRAGSGGGEIPGAFELLMHFRELRQQASKLSDAK